jgi:hypothetical protein
VKDQPQFQGRACAPKSNSSRPPKYPRPAKYPSVYGFRAKIYVEQTPHPTRTCKKIWRHPHLEARELNLWESKGQTEPDPHLVQSLGGTEVSAPTVTEPPWKSSESGKIRRSLQNSIKIGREIEGARVHRCYSTAFHGGAPWRSSMAELHAAPAGVCRRRACGDGAGRLGRPRECAAACGRDGAPWASSLLRRCGQARGSGRRGGDGLAAGRMHDAGRGRAVGRKKKRKKKKRIFREYAFYSFLLRIYSARCVFDPHIAFAGRTKLADGVLKMRGLLELL